MVNNNICLVISQSQSEVWRNVISGFIRDYFLIFKEVRQDKIIH